MSLLTWTIRSGWVVGMCLGLAVLSGCGSSGTVSGKITYEGQPLNGGTVTFISSQDGKPYSGPIQSDGSYRVEKIPTGKTKITVQVPEPPQIPDIARKSFGPPPGADVPEEAKKMFGLGNTKLVQIPKDYADPERSGLSYEVKAGHQTYDIVLKKK